MGHRTLVTHRGRGTDTLNEFDTIAEGIRHVAAVMAGKGLILDDLHTELMQGVSQGGHVIHQQGRMGLTRRAKFILDSEVDPDLARLEPTSSPGREMDRLFDLGYAEHTLVESNGPRLLAPGHGQLHVVDPYERHERPEPSQPKSPATVASRDTC